jgi:transmembrane sensor
MVPERIAYLILLFLHGRLSRQEHNELDAWVNKSDRNMQAFEELTDVNQIVRQYHLV